MGDRLGQGQLVRICQCETCDGTGATGDHQRGTRVQLVGRQKTSMQMGGLSSCSPQRGRKPTRGYAERKKEACCAWLEMGKSAIVRGPSVGEDKQASLLGPDVLGLDKTTTVGPKIRPKWHGPWVQ